MRPKVTFRRGRDIAKEAHPSGAAWIDEHAKPQDADLESDTLREIVQSWRTQYALVAKLPGMQDVRATLEGLTTCSDEEALHAVRAIDGRTQALLATAALRVYRRRHPKPAAVPAQVVDVTRWGPAEILAYAILALRDMPRADGGRPKVQGRHADFARELLAYWRHHRDAQPTLSRESETPFSRFAADMFRRVGYGLSHRQLHRILTAARQAG